MKPEIFSAQHILSGYAGRSDAPRMTAAVTTRFGEDIDVRNRGALKLGRFAGSQTAAQGTPAVVRLWSGECFRELSTHQARALAARLLEAAALAERQNSH